MLARANGTGSAVHPCRQLCSSLADEMEKQHKMCPKFREVPKDPSKPSAWKTIKYLSPTKTNGGAPRADTPVQRCDLAFVVGQIISKTSFYRQKILKSPRAPGQAAASKQSHRQARQQASQQARRIKAPTCTRTSKPPSQTVYPHEECVQLVAFNNKFPRRFEFDLNLDRPIQAQA